MKPLYIFKKIRNLLCIINRVCLVPIILLLIINLDCLSQEVSIKSVQLQANGDVNIYYELEDENPERKYALYLYASTDNYIQALQKVEGEVGVDLSLGKDKKLVWHAKQELGDDFNGNVFLELKGNVYVPFIALDGFDDYKVFKKGKPYDITWTGGRGDNILNFELYEGDKKIKVFEERANVGKATITIPKDVKPGDYRFKISDSRNRDEVVFTHNFQVKRKVPLIVPIIAGVAVLAVVGILVNNSSGNTEEPQIGNPPLPEGN